MWSIRQVNLLLQSLTLADAAFIAIPLAREGHQVSVCDISAAEVDLTIRKAKDAGIKFVESSSFDARDLRQHEDMFKPSYYDIVLLLGPLYHILDKAGRADVLLAALEAVKPGGYVLAAFVTRNAHLRDLSSRDPARIEREWDFYEQYLKDGRYTRGTKAPMHHATLGEIRGLISAMQDAERGRGIGSDLVKLVACEGFLGFHHASHLVGLGDGAFAKWLGVVVGSATDEANLGAADHILAVIQRTA